MTKPILTITSFIVLTAISAFAIVNRTQPVPMSPKTPKGGHTEHYVRSDQPTVMLCEAYYYVSVDGHGETAYYDVVISDAYSGDEVLATTIPGTYTEIDLPTDMATGSYVIDCTTAGGTTFTGSFDFTAADPLD